MDKNLSQSKENALNDFKEKKLNYILTPTHNNWILYCDAKINCMRLGVII